MEWSFSCLVFVSCLSQDLTHFVGWPHHASPKVDEINEVEYRMKLMKLMKLMFHDVSWSKAKLWQVSHLQVPLLHLLQRLKRHIELKDGLSPVSARFARFGWRCYGDNVSFYIYIYIYILYIVILYKDVFCSRQRLHSQHLGTNTIPDTHEKTREVQTNMRKRSVTVKKKQKQPHERISEQDSGLKPKKQLQMKSNTKLRSEDVKLCRYDYHDSVFFPRKSLQTLRWNLMQQACRFWLFSFGLWLQTFIALSRKIQLQHVASVFEEAPHTSPTTSLQLDSRTHALQVGQVDAFLIQGNVV